MTRVVNQSWDCGVGRYGRDLVEWVTEEDDGV
jgi:hypothetical protein